MTYLCSSFCFSENELYCRRQLQFFTYPWRRLCPPLFPEFVKKVAFVDADKKSHEIPWQISPAPLCPSPTIYPNLLRPYSKPQAGLHPTNRSIWHCYRFASYYRSITSFRGCLSRPCPIKTLFLYSPQPVRILCQYSVQASGLAKYLKWLGLWNENSP